MPSSHFIARLTGPVFSVVGIGALANRDVYRDIAAQALGNAGLVSLSGILALIAGLAILNAHPRWTADWRSLITFFGWFLSLIGVFRIFAPDLVRFVAAPTNSSTIVIAGLGLLVAGGILTFKGYVAEQPQAYRRESQS